MRIRHGENRDIVKVLRASALWTRSHWALGPAGIIGLKEAFGSYHIRRLKIELKPGRGRGLFTVDDPVNRSVNRKTQRLLLLLFS